MAHSPTTWYEFRLPEETDSMANPTQDTTESFQKIIDTKPDIISTSTLPQTGDYEVSDRVYLDANNSIYVCIAKNADWGIWWRPVQDHLSPWQPVPSTAFLHADYETHPTSPLEIATDSRGRAWWRGRIRVKSAATMVNGSNLKIFKDLPDGILPPANSAFICCIEPCELVASTPGSFAQYRGARFIIDTATGDNSMRIFGSTTTTPKTTDIWFSQVHYAIGREDYVTP